MAANLRLVKRADNGSPPRKLAKEGAALWRSVNEHYAITDAGGIAMLALACEQLDRAESCRKLIDKDGEMIRTKTGTREHPLLKYELAARAFVVKTLRGLGLDVEPVRPVGRPGGSFNYGD